MNSASEDYRSLSTRFADTVAAVPRSKWRASSPCAGWDATAVVSHVVDIHATFEQLAGREMEIPPATLDPLARFCAVQAIVQADLDDPDRASAAWDGFFGRTTFAEGVQRFVCFDLIVHRWDLATAAGLNADIAVDELSRLEGDIEFFGDAMRGSGVFGPAIEVAAGADRQTRLLAAIGRSTAPGVAPMG